MLKVKNLTRKYKNGSSFINAVDDITTNFQVGDFVFVLGQSGSGKSTLLNILCGLDTEIEGSVEIDGIDTSNFSKKEWAIYRNHYVGFVFQEYNLIEHLKVWENVALPLQFQGIAKNEAKKKAIEELDRVGLKKFAEKKPDQLSGGQAQRVAIARALVTNPKVIMADEPTGALDTELGKKIIGYLRKVSQDRIVVVVTHDEDLASEFASRTVRLADGKIIDDTGNLETHEKEQKELSFDRPKMKFSMMMKFAKNNIFSRMFRSLATSSIVSIGYISIFLLTFMIMGINSSISDTIGMFLPEDQYQIYTVDNTEVDPSDLLEISNMDIVDNARYNVAETVTFESRFGVDVSVSLTPVPYDQALLTQDATLYGRLPQDETEILINVNTAAQMRGISQIDEDSFDYIFDLVKNSSLDLEYKNYSEFELESIETLGTYKIVGMVASTLMMDSVVYIDYDKLLSLSEQIHDEVNYREIALLYLSTENEDDIEAFTVLLRDDYNIVVENFFSAITSTIENFMYNALKIFIGIAAISLVVSGILIGLVIYTSIIERIKEIGILTAIGAKQTNIIGIFLAESAMIGLLSSGIATLFALLLTRIINGLFSSFIEKPLSLLSSGLFDMTLLTPKIWVIGVVILFSVLYSMIAGLIPSLKASRLNAIKALRRE